jgi:ribonuclease-3
VSLLQIALTHSSGAGVPHLSNERLEFLGDAVLGYVICEIVFMRHPDDQEGELTKMKSAIVSRTSCHQICKRLGLEEFLILGRGLRDPSRMPPSLLANVVESLIAAIYLDGGIDAAYDFIERTFAPEIEKFGVDSDQENFKSLLQHKAQKMLGHTPSYTVLSVTGPEHRKVFQVAVLINTRQYQPAWGTTKKVAEQRAAENALAILNGEDPPYY